MADPNSVDAADAVFNLLRTGESASSLRELLVSGTDGVYEAGDVTSRLLTQAESVRRASEAADDEQHSDALLVAVHDAGEQRISPGIYQQMITVRVYDRERGYRNIRSVRRELMRILQGVTVVLVAESDDVVRRGLCEIRFTSRTGHRFDTAFLIEYEAINFVAVLESQDLY